MDTFGDIALQERCPDCGNPLTLMISGKLDIVKDGDMMWCLVKRCLICGNYPVTEVLELGTDFYDKNKRS